MCVCAYIINDSYVIKKLSQMNAFIENSNLCLVYYQKLVILGCCTVVRQAPLFAALLFDLAIFIVNFRLLIFQFCRVQTPYSLKLALTLSVINTQQTHMCVVHTKLRVSYIQFYYHNTTANNYATTAKRLRWGT